MIYKEVTKKQLDEWVENSINQHKEFMEKKEERENNPPECPETCEYKSELLETSLEKLVEAEDITLKYKNSIASFRYSSVLQDMRLKQNEIYKLNQELKTLANYLETIYGSSEKE